jgi:hypothetical protein
LDPYIKTLLAKSTNCYGAYSGSSSVCASCPLQLPCEQDTAARLRILVEQFRSRTSAPSAPSSASNTDPFEHAATQTSKIEQDEDLLKLLDFDAPKSTKKPEKAEKPDKAEKLKPSTPPSPSTRGSAIQMISDMPCEKCGAVIPQGTQGVFHMDPIRARVVFYHQACYPP